MIGKAIYNILTNDTDVSALVSTRVFPELAVDDIAYPYIVIEQSSHEPEDTKCGVSTMDVIEYDIYIFSETNAEISDLATKCRNALDRYSGTVEGLEIQSTRFITQALEYDDNDRVFGLGQSYSFRFQTIYSTLSAVTNLAAAANGSTQIDLTWTDNSTGESGFEVWRGTDGVGWILITTTAANATSYSNTGLSAGDAFVYKVRPTDGTNGGEWSNMVVGCTGVAGGVTPSGILYQFPTLTGQTTSYRTGDEANLVASGEYDYSGIPANPATIARLDTSDADPFQTLNANNAFGNTNRFTDDAGGQTYANDLVIDHLTGLMWYRILQTTAAWNDVIDNAAASTQGSHSDWRLPNAVEMKELVNSEALRNMNYTPFSLNTNSTFYTSTTDSRNTSRALYYNNNLTSSSYELAVAKTTSRQYLLVRNHYV